MRKIPVVRLLAAVSIVSASVAPALAENMYVAASIGQSKVNINKAEIDNALTNAGVTGLSSSIDDTDTAYKLQVGYQFTPNIAAEIGYVDLGKLSYNAAYTGGTASATAKVTGWTVAALGILPLNNSYSLFAKLGMIDGKVQTDVWATGPGGSATANASSTNWRPNYGLGVAYSATKTIDVRGEYERFDDLGDANKTGKGNVDLLSVGVAFRF